MRATAQSPRYPRLVPNALLALFVALSLPLASCSSIPDRGETGSVIDERKTGSATRVLRLEGMEVIVLREGKPYPPYLLDLKAFPHEDGVRLGIVMVNDELRFGECQEIALFADDVSVPLRRVEYLHTRGNERWFEGWWIDVGYESLAKLAAATRTGGTFCEAEMWLDEDQRALLKDFAVRIIR